MNENRLSEAFESLPREQAGPAFTTAVLRRLEAPPRRRALAPLRLAAAVACLLAVVLGGHQLWNESQRQQSLARLEVMRVERRALEVEMRQLRRMAADARPVVYLGGNDDLDLVLDLSRLASRGSRGEMRPASFDSETTIQPTAF